MAPDMPYRRRTTVRDSPFICVIFGVALMFASFSDDNTQVPRQRLQALVGTVAGVSQYSTGGRHSVSYVDLMLRDDSGSSHELRQRYGVTSYAPGLMSLHSGDHVATLVEDKGGRLVLWEVTRDEVPVLAYDSTCQFYASKRRWAVLLRVVALCLVLAGAFLRVRMGTWREPNPNDF
jgi:hypothetical protein